MITTILIIGGVFAVVLFAVLTLVLVKSAKIAEDAITHRSLCPACLVAGLRCSEDHMDGEAFTSAMEACPVCGGLRVGGAELPGPLGSGLWNHRLIKAQNTAAATHAFPLAPDAEFRPRARLGRSGAARTLARRPCRPKRNFQAGSTSARKKF